MLNTTIFLTSLPPAPAVSTPFIHYFLCKKIAGFQISSNVFISKAWLILSRWQKFCSQWRKNKDVRLLNAPDCLIREVNYFLSDVFLFNWKSQAVPLLVKEKILKHRCSSRGEKKRILRSCELNPFLHSHICFYFYSRTSNPKEKALEVNSRFLKCLSVHGTVLFSPSQKTRPSFTFAVPQCLSFVLQQCCLFLKIDTDEFHPSFTETQERQTALKTNSTTRAWLIY